MKIPIRTSILLIGINGILAFDFLIENGQTTFASNVEVKDFQFVTNFDITGTTLDKLVTTCTNILLKIQSIAAYKTNPLLYPWMARFITKGSEYALRISSVGKTIAKYLQNTAETPIFQSCIFNYTMVSENEVEELITYLTSEQEKIDITWSHADLQSDKSKLNIIHNALQNYKTELKNLDAKLGTLLSILDTFHSNIYPHSLYGIYHDTTCLGMMKNEELFIKSCKTFKTQLICEIEIWHPKTIQTLPVVISVPYFGYSLVGSNGEETFVKGTLSNFYQSLTCQSVPPLHKSYKTCQLNRLPLACDTSLAAKDYANIVHNCIFAKTAHAASSIRLADKSILVIDNQVKLTIQGTLGTEQVTTTTPYQLYNAEKVSLEVAGLTVQYAGIENLTTTKIRNTSIPVEVLHSFQQKLHFLQYASLLAPLSIFDYGILSFQGFIVIILAVTIGLKCRKRKRVRPIKQLKYPRRLVPLAPLQRTRLSPLLTNL